MRGKRNGDEISAAMTGDDLLETIAQNWVQCAASGITLETRNNTYFFEETYSVSVQREGGLGLILGEVWASPGFDDEGLVLVEEVVRGSNAANAGGIAVGDTILGVSGTRGVASGVATEGKNWDAKENVRAMEHWTRDLGGWQACYTDMFCTHHEFREMFNHDLLDKVRERLHCLDAFPLPYTKMKPEKGIVDLVAEETAEKEEGTFVEG